MDSFKPTVDELEEVKNRKLVILSIIGGILMIIGATTGNLILHFLLSEFASRFIQNEFILRVIYSSIIVCEIVANTGGIAVIIGTLLMITNHYHIGKFLSVLGTGFGLIGFIILVVFQVIGGMIAGGTHGIIIFSTTLSGIFGLGGIVITIIARRDLKRADIIEKFTASLIHIRDKKSIIIVNSIITFFFILFEILILSIFSRLQFLHFSVMLLWQMALISNYIVFILLSINYKYFRLIFLNITLVLSSIALIFLFNLHSLYFLKIFLIIIVSLAFIGDYYSLKLIKQHQIDVDRKAVFIIILFFSLTITSVGLLILPRHKIVITPKTSPELIFWTHPRDLPDQVEVLETCKKYNIGFMPGIAPWSFNDSSYMNKYKLAISNGINLYFCLLAHPNSFANMDNFQNYIPLYKDYRDWFIKEGILNSSHIKAFCIDAEPPQRYTEKIAEANIIDSLNYYIDNFPTKQEKQDATENLNELIDLIHEDGKDAGIIRISPYMDKLDGDGDIELMLRNLYSLDVHWDFSITMLYRTERVVAGEGDTAEAFITQLMRNVFGRASTTDLNVLPAYNFYKRVGMIQSRSEIKTDENYVFIGNLNKIFNGTDYMKNKEYLKDLDICRHFNEKKVFFYSFENFIANYGEDELEKLGKYNEKLEPWDLVYDSIETQISIVFYLMIMFFDRFLFLDF